MKACHSNISHRIKIVKGQLEGILAMVEEDRYCIDISNQIMAVTQALKGINKDILVAHLHSCISDTMDSHDEKDKEVKIEEMAKIIERLSK